MLNTTKQCTKCDKIKDLSEYGKHTQTKDGLTPACKECNNIKSQLYKKTKVGVLQKIYDTQKQSAKKRNHNPPTYTKQELKDWLFAQELFHDLYDEWVLSGYEILLKPSVHRKDDYKSYTIDNIVLVTWEENLQESYKDRLDGNNNKASKGVNQFTLDGEFIVRYHSIREAERNTTIADTGIIDCCKGKYSQAGGFKWEYA